MFTSPMFMNLRRLGFMIGLPQSISYIYIYAYIYIYICVCVQYIYIYTYSYLQYHGQSPYLYAGRNIRMFLFGLCCSEIQHFFGAFQLCLCCAGSNNLSPAWLSCPALNYYKGPGSNISKNGATRNPLVTQLSIVYNPKKIEVRISKPKNVMN